jgi:hypothetical protein
MRVDDGLTLDQASRVQRRKVHSSNSLSHDSKQKTIAARSVAHNLR